MMIINGSVMALDEGSFAVEVERVLLDSKEGMFTLERGAIP